MKKYYFIIILLLVAALLIGYFSALGNLQNARQSVVSNPLFSFLNSLPPWLLLIFIFLNNVIKSFLVILLGFFFGLVPIYFIYINGVGIGEVIAIAQTQTKWDVILAALLPHGIFEIPAIIIASSAGLHLGHRFYRYLRYREDFRAPFFRAMSIFTHFVLPLLIIAAIIETFITPIFISYFLK